MKQKKVELKKENTLQRHHEAANASAVPALARLN